MQSSNHYKIASLNLIVADVIMEKLKEAGFMISLQKDMQLTKEIAGEIYKSKVGILICY